MKSFVFLLGLIFANLVQASSTVNRVGLLEDAPTDYALRLRLIQNARQSIDLIMSQHRADTEIGLPLLLAMRDAAKRGIKVRLMSGYFSSIHSDSTQALRFILNDDSLSTRPELMLDGEWFKTPIPSPNATMWTAFDEKIMIVDGEKAVIGGRNVGNEYLIWHDNSLYLEGAIVAEIQNRFFNPTWKLATELFGKSRQDIAKYPASHEAWGKFQLSAPLIAGAAAAAEMEASPEYTPASIEMLHNGAIARMAAHPGQRISGEVPDPILERFLALAKHSKRAYYYSLYPYADKRLIQGLTEAVKNGSTVGLITNSLSSSKYLNSITWPYAIGIKTMRELVEGGVSVYQWKPTPDSVFMHQKMAVVDDYVIFGSHNFNWSSTHGYDHMNVIIHDPALADLLAKRFEQQAAEHTWKVNAEFLKRQQATHFIGIGLSELLRGLY